METKKTLEERIEQAAYDIIIACEHVQEICKGDPELEGSYTAARSAKFHAEGILTGVRTDEGEVQS